MCGFAGFASDRKNWGADDMYGVVNRMSEALIHRGPDDHGSWIDNEAGVALGFRRLSIIDLSPAGHQPMLSDSGRFAIVFNGEVYNFEAIRRELLAARLAPPFRGHSDTEVILAAIEAWGLQEAVKRFIGMFAIALWDRRSRELHLVRDRLGVKPLYYGWTGGSFVFGSELKALRRHPAFNPEVDRRSLASLVRYNFIPAPYTIYRDIRKLTPGCILTVGPGRSSAEEKAYWSVEEAVECGVSDPWKASYTEAVDELDRLLRDSIRLRMVADVPLGVFLSGGIDSTVVTALMQDQSSRPIRTFSIGFHEEGYDEAKNAAAVAAHLGTEHTEMYVTPAEAMAVIPRLPDIFDEPFADSSQIPTYIVSELARRHVTVALSGDGGDELFGGYGRYLAADPILRRISKIPDGVRYPLGRLLSILSSALLDGYGERVLPGRLRNRINARRLQGLATLLAAPAVNAMYQHLLWPDPGSVVLGPSGHQPALAEPRRSGLLSSPMSRMMYLDTISYLPDDILVKVDRASMAVSLEAREPLLDHRLVEFAWRLPMDMKVHDDGGKRVLREVLQRYVPRELMDRPKRGFAVPVGRWLRGSLRPWAEELLDERRMEGEGYFDPKHVRRLWAEHQNGTGDSCTQLWSILAFQAWLDGHGVAPRATMSEASGAEIGNATH